MRWFWFALETLGLMLLPTGVTLLGITGLWYRIFDCWPSASEVWGVVVKLSEMARGVIG